MKRKRPMIVAPLIPLWGILAFFGVEFLRGTRYLGPFVVVILLLLATLFTYVLNQALQARRRSPTREAK